MILCYIMYHIYAVLCIFGVIPLGVLHSIPFCITVYIDWKWNSIRRFHFLDRCHSRFGTLSKWAPWSKSSREFGPGSPYLLTNMALWDNFWTPRCELDSSRILSLLHIVFSVLYQNISKYHKSHIVFKKKLRRVWIKYAFH